MSDLEKRAAWAALREFKRLRAGLRAARREIEETGKFAAQVPEPRNCIMEILETARAALKEKNDDTCTK